MEGRVRINQGGGRGWGRGGDRDWVRDGGRRGGRDWGRGGGRGGGRFWSEQRRSLEGQGLEVQTNCYQLVPQNNDTNIMIHQYMVTIDALVKKRDVNEDSMYSPAAENQLPKTPEGKGLQVSYFVKRTYHTEVFRADDNRSTSLSRRILNCCQRKLQDINPNQSFVRFFLSQSVVIHLTFSLTTYIFQTRFMMGQTLHILEINYIL